MRTVAELKRLFRARVEDAESEYGQTLIELVIRRLKDRGYLNDSQYAAYFSSLRRDNQKFGRLRVVTDLKVKGVHGDVIDKAVDAAFESVNEAQTGARISAARSAWPNRRIKKRRRGFFVNWSAPASAPRPIFSILKNWDVDEETLTALEERDRLSCGYPALWRFRSKIEPRGFPDRSHLARTIVDSCILL